MKIKRIRGLQISIFVLVSFLLLAQARPLHALTEPEIKRLTTGWSIDVQHGGSRAASSKSGSSTVNGRGTTLGVSEKVLTTSRSLDGTIRLANTAEGSRSVVVQVRWIGRDAKSKGFTAVCWDGSEGHTNMQAGVSCSYKNVAPSTCTGGGSAGYVYECKAQ